MAALRQAGTWVLEPIHRFRLELPTDCYGAVLAELTALHATPGPPWTSRALRVVEGEVPANQVHRLEQRLPELTQGEGVLESWFDRWAQVLGAPPRRRRTDHNPLNRKDYLMRLQHRR